VEVEGKCVEKREGKGDLVDTVAGGSSCENGESLIEFENWIEWLRTRERRVEFLSFQPTTLDLALLLIRASRGSCSS